MTRYGMLINTRRCVGCFACRLGCQMKNHLEPEESFIDFEERERGVFPVVHNEIIPLQCQHCEEAPCQSVCPTNATYTTDSGVVLVEEEKCIGCKYCMAACPYGARIQIEETGVIEKCRFCFDGDEEQPQPACVGTCITNTRLFGDLDDPESEISREILRLNAQPLSVGLTKSKIYYVR